jgi:Na+-translocating ferredoxin:NAD+ oxidoreductase subunit B
MNSETAPDLVARIDALLPQTQCARCGYEGCRPYAVAIASGAAQINQCPPGGAAAILALAALLGRPALALNPIYGSETPPRVAWIDESRCIGCARCLAPCPVDAIVGAPKHMHTVVTARCTGCELCLPPCPVDCIELKESPAPAANQSTLNRRRFEAHAARLRNQSAQRQREIDDKKRAAVARRMADS